MKKLIGMIALIICLSMVVSFSGCGKEVVNDNNEVNNEVNNNDEVNNEENNNNEVDNDNNDILEFAAPEITVPDDVDLSVHMDINYMGRNTNNSDIDKYTLVKDELERMFNITFDFAPASGKNNDMELIAAADAVPECAWIYLGSTEKAWTLYRDGLTRAIPMDYVQKYAPFMWQTMQIDKSFHEIQLIPGTEDQYYVLFASRYGMYELGSGTAVRMDWLENLGLTPKGDLTTIITDSVYITNEAYLLNDFTDILYDFTFSDPDMNSENDTFGLATYGLQSDGFSYGGTLYSAFSMKNTFTPNEDGWAVPIIFSDANFKFFKQLGEWKDLGVVPVGFETKAISNWEQMWESGKYGATAFEQKQLSIDLDKLAPDFIDDSVPLNLFNSNPDAKIILTPPLLDSDGTGGHGRSYENYIRASGAGYFYIREDVSDEKLKRILMLYDYMSCNPDGLFFCCFGNYDVHWGYDNNGYRYTLPQEDLPDNEKWDGYEFFYTPCVANYTLATTFPQQEVNVVEDFQSVRSAMGVYVGEGNWPSLGYTYVETNLPTNWSEGLEWTEMPSMQARSKAYKAARTELLAGSADPETIWDNLMNTLKNVGYDEYIDALNHNVYLRDELFNDGLAVTPAEKFPLE